MIRNGEEVTLDHVIRHRIGVTEDFLDIDNYDMTQFGSEAFLKLAFERPVPRGRAWTISTATVHIICCPAL